MAGAAASGLGQKLGFDTQISPLHLMLTRFGGALHTFAGGFPKWPKPVRRIG